MLRRAPGQELEGAFHIVRRFQCARRLPVESLDRVRDCALERSNRALRDASTLAVGHGVRAASARERRRSHPHRNQEKRDSCKGEDCASAGSRFLHGIQLMRDLPSPLPVSPARVKELNRSRSLPSSASPRLIRPSGSESRRPHSRGRRHDHVQACAMIMADWLLRPDVE